MLPCQNGVVTCHTFNSVFLAFSCLVSHGFLTCSPLFSVFHIKFNTKMAPGDDEQNHINAIRVWDTSFQSGICQVPYLDHLVYTVL